MPVPVEEVPVVTRMSIIEAASESESKRREIQMAGLDQDQQVDAVAGSSEQPTSLHHQGSCCEDSLLAQQFRCTVKHNSPCPA